MTKAYTATATRDGAWWMVEITGPDLRRSGATQVKRLDQAEDMVRDWIKTRFDTITDADFTVEVVAEFDEEDESVVQAAVAKRIAAEAATTASTTATVDAIMRLGKMGLPSRDIAAILGISFQYAAAVLSHPKKNTTSSSPSEPRQRRVIGTRAKTEPVAPAQRSRRKVEA